MMERTKVSVGLVTILFASTAAGIFFFNFFFLILGFTSATLFVVSYLQLPPSSGSIQVKRSPIEAETYQGAGFTIKLTIENKSESSVFLEIKDGLPENVKRIEGSNHRYLYLDGKEKKEIGYKIEFLRAENYTIGPVKLRYNDPLKLFSKDWEFDETTHVVALPPIEDLGRTKLRPKRTTGWLGNIKSSTMGVGSEFFSIREYHQGDELRDINWKATARYLDPKTNSYEAEKSGDVVLIVDAFEGSNIGVFEENTLSHSIKAAASLASDIIADRNRVGLLVIGNFVRWVYPRSGEEQLYKIMDNLMDLESGSYWRLEHAQYILDKIFPDRCMLIFISPLTDDRVLDAIADLSMTRYELAVVSPSPIELQKKYLDTDGEIAEKLEKIERHVKMDRLRDYGPVIDWNPEEPLEVAVEGVRRYQMRS